MYSHTISEMVDAGVAVKLDTPVWMKRNGEISEKEAAYGCKVFHRLMRPDMCICGGIVEGNLSIKGDRYVTGHKLLTGVGKIPQEKSSKQNRRFIMIRLTAFTGDPVICILILKGKNPKGNIEAGKISV